MLREICSVNQRMRHPFPLAYFPFERRAKHRPFLICCIVLIINSSVVSFSDASFVPERERWVLRFSWRRVLRNNPPTILNFVLGVDENHERSANG